MKKNIQYLALAFVILLTSSAIFAQKERRIKFPKGAKSVTVAAYLHNYKSRKAFVIRLREGQTLKISSDQRVTLTVLNPSGEDVVDRDLSCNSRAEISPTVAGDYKIEVVECMKADAWRGQFKLKISAK